MLSQLWVIKCQDCHDKVGSKAMKLSFLVALKPTLLRLKHLKMEPSLL